MPILHFELDLSGRPIVDLAVMVSSVDLALEPDQTYAPYPVKALVDTGAGRSQVDVAILNSFGIGQSGDIKIFTASTGEDFIRMPLFLIDLFFTGDAPGLLAQNLQVVGSDRLSGTRVDMLLGRDVLNRCLLVHDGVKRRFTLAYNPPPVEDQATA